MKIIVTSGHSEVSAADLPDNASFVEKSDDPDYIIHSIHEMFGA